MQFKKVGQRIQVLRYEGYDKDRRRAIVRMVGSVGRYNYLPSVGLFERLTAEECKEVEAFIQAEQGREAAATDARTLRVVLSQLEKAAPLLDAGNVFDVGGLDPARAARVWRSIRALQKSMVSAGFPRGRRTTKNSVKTDPRQQSIPGA